MIFQTSPRWKGICLNIRITSMYHSIRASKELQLQSPTNRFWNGRLYPLHNTLCVKGFLGVTRIAGMKQSLKNSSLTKVFFVVSWASGSWALPIAWSKWQHYVSKGSPQFGSLILNVTAFHVEAGGDIIPEVKQPCDAMNIKPLILTGKDKQASITNIQFCSRTRFWCWQAKKCHPTISSISYLNNTV